MQKKQHLLILITRNTCEYAQDVTCPTESSSYEEQPLLPIVRGDKQAGPAMCFSHMSVSYTYRGQGMLLRLFAAASSSFRAVSVQHSSRLWSLASWQKVASWHHTCSSTTASDQLHSDAMLASFRWREKETRVRGENGGGGGRGVEIK